MEISTGVFPPGRSALAGNYMSALVLALELQGVGSGIVLEHHVRYSFSEYLSITFMSMQDLNLPIKFISEIKFKLGSGPVFDQTVSY